MRKIVNFNRNWLFSKTAEIPADLPSGWEEISLPHTWNAVDGQEATTTGGVQPYIARNLKGQRWNPADGRCWNFWAPP